MTCPELLSKDARKRTENGLPPVGAVRHHRYAELHYEGRKLIRNWAQRSSEKLGCEDTESFEPFIFGWIAVNGWASCVTGEETDRKYLDVLMADDDLGRRFDELRANADFTESVQQFHRLWPIFRSQDVGYVPSRGHTREEMVDEYMRRTPLPRHRPDCWIRHRTAKHEIPIDWPHTLAAIYQVRCNLFHGYKGVHSENDVAIVSRAFNVLVRMLPMLQL